jgi:hypothetical protein
LEKAAGILDRLAIDGRTQFVDEKIEKQARLEITDVSIQLEGEKSLKRVDDLIAALI